MSDIEEFAAAVSKETGVPEEFLSGDSPHAIWDGAERLTRWKASAGVPPPTTAAVPACSPPPTRITPQPLDGDYLAAWRGGRWSPLGIPAPPPRAPRNRRGMPW
jgi:hypothetical protein